jgi:putative transposase
VPVPGRQHPKCVQQRPPEAFPHSHRPDNTKEKKKRNADRKATEEQFLERRSALSSPFQSPTIGGMAEYRQRAHAVFDLKYDMIWCTKYRKKVQRGRIAERARDLIRQIWAAREVVIVRGSVSPDHIHLLLSAPPMLAPAKWAQYIKGRSSRHLQAEFPELRKQYWGQHMWARGYFCATVGAVDEATIKAYIENQKWDEDDESFKITAPTKP